MAELFAKEGAKVVMTARGKEKLDVAVQQIRDQGYDVTGVVADNKNLDDVKRVIQTALDVYGDLDIVINNAAIGEQKMIDETDDEWLEHVYQTNVFGPFRFIREALKIFLPKNEGCIINISSVNGDRPFCGASYTSSKGAINTLKKNVAMRLIDTNIRINAVAPGATVTPAHLANKAGEQPGGAKMLEYSKHFVYFPGPECDPMDQANACLFLASDMGKHVKGQVIQVCNGAFYKSVQEVKTLLAYYDQPEETTDYSVICSFTPPKELGKCVYCNHCKPCPVGIDIGLVNKYYDLALAGDAMAVEHYRTLEKNADDCIACGHCDNRCPFSVKQSERMQEIRSYMGLKTR